MIHFNAPYEVIICADPEGKHSRIYGIHNTETQVIEAYIGQLAKAKLFCDLFARDLRVGLKAPEDELSAIFNSFRLPEDGGESGGGLNG